MRLFHPELEKIESKICKCGKVFSDVPSIIKKRKYCSAKCYHKYSIPWNKGKQFCPKGHDTFIVGRAKDNTCKKCIRESAARLYQKNKVYKNKITKQSIWKSKGMQNLEGKPFTLLDYEKLLKQQNDKCLICSKNQLELNVSLSVDHDHSTGKVRGLLCQICNSILGMVNEDPKILVKMINYLIKNQPLKTKNKHGIIIKEEI